jgi:hypothetical protein
MKHRANMTLAAGICWSALTIGAAVADDAGSNSLFIKETPVQHDARMAWWRDARFGMFIHWGLYSEAAGEWNGTPTHDAGFSGGAGEWIMNDMQIPLSQYATLVPQFNPVKFDADAWVRAAKDAGMKYIVITSKHHEGFGMFPLAAHRLVHQVHAVPARTAQGTRRRLPETRHQTLFLLLDHGLAFAALRAAQIVE